MSERQDKLRRIILEAAETLKDRIQWADPVAILGAMAEVESDFGEYAVARHERQFDWGGKWFNKELWKLHGSIMACSFSSFQIMFPVCVELGLPKETHPCDLNDDDKAMPWILEYIRKRILDQGCHTLRQFGDAWNSGSFKDSYVPERYIEKFENAYMGVVHRRKLVKGE